MASPSASARQADRVSAILLLLFGGFVILEARALPYWTGNAPGPGFLPFWLGVLLACASAATLARTFAAGRVDPALGLPNRATAARLAVVVGLTAAAAALSLMIGVVLASAMFMGATLAYLRPDHRRANAIAAVLTPVVVWLIFVRWLAVPLPPGPLGF